MTKSTSDQNMKLPAELSNKTAIEDDDMPPWTSVSFACGGWLQFYMFGVAKALQESGLDYPSKVTYCGCSAGALAAVGLSLEGNFDSAVTFCKEKCVPQAHGHVTGLFKLGDYVSECIDSHLMPKYQPIEDGKLQIAVTKLWPFLQTERVTAHTSKEDLKLTLMASIAAFPAAPLVYRREKWFVDGGISDFQPIVDENTITVSPFYFSDCDIKPSRYVPLWWCCIPPKSNDTIDWLYALGYEDCIAYVEKRGLANLNRKKKIAYEQLVKTSHPYDVPRRVSVHRFLGYNLGNMTHQYVSFTMDFLLLLVFLFLLKPLALAFIYFELLLKIIYFSVISVLRKAMLSKGNDTLKAAWVCFTCIISLSLMLRFFSGRPSSVELRKHDKLAKISMLYRVFRHII